MLRDERLDWIGLLCRALLAGFATSIALGLLTLAFASSALAGSQEPGLRLYGAHGEALGQAPQLRTEVVIRVTGALARVRVVQRFRNASSAWVEGIYVFPLPEDAAVDRLQMRYAGRLIEGEVQEREQARQTYVQARAQGQGAGLLDQQRDNIFTTSVANIPPGETLRVEIEYQQQLQWRDGEFTLRFPTVVGPRYIPGTPLAAAAHGSGGHGWAPDTDQVPDASRITPPVVTGADSRFNALSISALLDTGIALSELSSAYHPIAVARLRPGRYRVTLASGDVPAERDFVLRWRPVLAAQPSAALFSEHWRGQDYALLMLMPPQQSAIPQHIARELVLVVDTSGSMHGDSIEQARAALLNALQRLRPGDRFNVVQFSDQVRALYGQAAPADPAHLEQARRYVRGLQAAGGTEMLPALRHALHDPVPSGLLRQVVFITDGAVGNEQALFRALVDEIGASRLFTVGIGSAPNALFMRKAAAFGRGSFTYIGSTGEVEQRVATLFRQLSMPVLTDVRLHWQAQDAARPPLQTPQAVPDLYAGEPLVVALQARALPHRVEIEGRLGAQPWRQTLELPQTMAPGGTLAGGVHVLWARRMIDDWMARLLTGDPPDRVREAVLALALDHHLVSRYTSLVAVDHTPTRPDASGFATAAVPARLPAGWSAAAVFGRLPGTATPAALYLLIGLAGLAVATLLARWRA